MANSILQHIRELVEMGYPLDQLQSIPLSISISDFNEKIEKMKEEVTQWNDEMHAGISKYPKLLLLTMPKILQLYNLLIKDNHDENQTKQICHEVRYLLPNNLLKFEDTQSKVKVCYTLVLFDKSYPF